MIIDPKNISLPELHRIILSSVAPRPIAFASTVDKDGNHNLSPFSFFNAFGINPPTLVFSPSRRGRDNTTKHTYENLKEVPEVVINTVNFDMVEQMSLSSGEYDKGVDEYIKSGLTPVDSELVKPKRVLESPVSYECKVKEIIELSQEPGAGNLVICEIIRIHVKDDILDRDGEIDQEKIDLVGRLGGDLYSRTNGESIFKVTKPGAIPGIGYDALPDYVKNSHILSGNDLGKLGSLTQLPSPEEILTTKEAVEVQAVIKNAVNVSNELQYYVKRLIRIGDVEKALKVLMCI
ncbi:MAG: flavin reductase [Bacteroidetes bacterium]|nr:flavin reductase [Bacteroidota bacterium]